MNWKNLTAPPEGRTEVISRSTSYGQVFGAVREYAREGAGLVRPLAQSLRGRTEGETARRVYAFIKDNVRYAHDPDGIEQIALPNRTLHEGKGDCDDMAILAASLFLAMGFKPRLYVVRTGRNPEWNHIFCTLGDRPHPRDRRILGYVVDPVPPLTRFDQLCDNIKETTEIMQLHALRGLEGTGELFEGIAGIAPMTQITRQAVERERGLLRDFAAASTPRQKQRLGREFRKNRCLMAMNGLPEQQIMLGLMGAIENIDDSGRAILSDDADLDAVAEYLDGQTASLLAGLGAPKVLQKIKSLVKKPAPKTVPGKASAPKKTILKVANALTKVNPLTVAARNGAYAVLKLNLFRLGSKFAKAYLTEAEAKAQGLDLAEWRKLKEAWPRVEQLFYGIGADPANLKKHILEGAAKGAKRGIKGTEDDPVSLLAGLLGIDGDALGDALDSQGVDAHSLLSGNGLGNPALVQAAAVIAPIVANAVVEAIRQKKKARKGIQGGLGDGGLTLGAVLTAASGVLASIAKITENVSFKKMTAGSKEPLDDEHRDYKNPKAAEGGGLLQNVMNVANQVKNAVKDVLPMVKPAQGGEVDAAVDAGGGRDTGGGGDGTPKDGTNWAVLALGGAAVVGGLLFLTGKKGKKR